MVYLIIFVSSYCGRWIFLSSLSLFERMELTVFFFYGSATVPVETSYALAVQFL